MAQTLATFDMDSATKVELKPIPTFPTILGFHLEEGPNSLTVWFTAEQLHRFTQLADLRLKELAEHIDKNGHKAEMEVPF